MQSHCPSTALGFRNHGSCSLPQKDEAELATSRDFRASRSFGLVTFVCLRDKLVMFSRIQKVLSSWA